MKLVRFLLRTSRGLMLFTALAALISGACNAGLIALANATLSRPAAATTALIWCFVGLGVAKLLSNFVSQYLLARFTQEAVAGLRHDLVRKILDVPLRRLEETGAPRLMVALTEDVMFITQALLSIPLFAVNVAILLGGAAYLGWLSGRVLAGMLGLLLVGALGYRLLILGGFGHLQRARETEDSLFAHFRALIEGIKELKLHRNRRGAFFLDNIQVTTAAYQQHNVAAEARFILAHTWGQAVVFALIGLILFALPSLEHIGPKELTGYVVTVLFLMGPLSGVLGCLSVFGRANVALQKIEALGLALNRHAGDASPMARVNGQASFERLELRGVTHSYNHEKDDSHFTLGPVHLSFAPGDLVFLVGGNGSGKSTLAKLITGLYPPETGEVRLNGRTVRDENRDDYRQLFSAVFADFFVFDGLLGLEHAGLDDRAQGYLAQLHLDHKVKVRNGAFSTTALSHGQRKRLALLTAYLEDRPFYLFDEWASDQDPQFKEVFYEQLLPELKARDKAVVVITHDEKYFHLADHIVKLDYGKVVSERPVRGQTPEPALRA
ncbi:MAG TPA: cyclic peptide export ABC transporter [Verrucomicrobiae bacterium]|jgi:putative ATP-binding cassette transporter